MIKRITALASSALACALGAVFFIAPPASASGEVVQLDEVQTNGDGGASDEFIAIINTSGSAVDIQGYRFVTYDDADTATVRYTVPTGTPVNVAAGARFIVAGTGYNNGGTPNVTTTLNMPQRGGAQIQNGSSAVQDSVAFRDLLSGTTGAPSAQEGTNAQTNAPVLNPLDLSNQKVADQDQNETDWDLGLATF